MSKSRSIEILKLKAEWYRDLANHVLGKGHREEATEYYIRCACFREAIRIVEGCDRE